jgi:hypothetical protein
VNSGASGASPRGFESAGPGYPLQYLRYFRFYPLRFAVRYFRFYPLRFAVQYGLPRQEFVALRAEKPLKSDWRLFTLQTPKTTR